MNPLDHLPDALLLLTDTDGIITSAHGGGAQHAPTNPIGVHMDEFLQGYAPGLPLALAGKATTFEKERWGRKFFVHMAPILEGEKVVGAVGLGVRVTDAPEFLRVSDLARALHLSEAAIRKRFQRGVFPQKKVGGHWVMTPEQFAELRPEPG